jgi:UDP-glucose 6-dehydrogenase
MNWICIIYGFGACVTTHILTKMLYNKNNELHELKKHLYEAQQQVNNYRESGAIEKVKIYVKTYPNEKTGVKSLMFHSELVTPEEAEKRKNDKYGLKIY